MFPNWAKIILFLIVFMISGLVLVIIIDGLVSGTELIPLNTAIEQVIALVRTPSLTTLLVFITRLGSPFVLSSITLFIAVILAVRGRLYDAALLIFTLVLAIVSLTVLKNTFQVARPLTGLTEGGWSFPSGHATIATTFFFLLAHTYFHRMKTVAGRVTLILGSIVGVALVSFSRLYLGAHWTLDVLAGITLGLLCVSFSVLMFNLFLGDRHTDISRIS